MPRRDFSGGHPRVGQWVWIDERKDYRLLGVVQGSRAAPASCKVTREGRVTRVESTAVLGGRRAVCALKDLPEAVNVAVISSTGAHRDDVHAEVEIDRLTPLLDKTAIPWQRRKDMAPNWSPQP